MGEEFELDTTHWPGVGYALLSASDAELIGALVKNQDKPRIASRMDHVEFDG